MGNRPFTNTSRNIRHLADWEKICSSKRQADTYLKYYGQISAFTTLLNEWSYVDLHTIYLTSLLWSSHLELVCLKSLQALEIKNKAESTGNIVHYGAANNIQAILMLKVLFFPSIPKYSNYIEAYKNKNTKKWAKIYN